MWDKIEAGLSQVSEEFNLRDKISQLQSRTDSILSKIKAQLAEAKVGSLLAAKPVDEHSAKWTADGLWHEIKEMVTALERGTAIPNKNWICRFVELHQKYVELANQLQLSSSPSSGPSIAEVSEQLRVVLEDPVVKFILDSPDCKLPCQTKVPADRDAFECQSKIHTSCDAVPSGAADRRSPSMRRIRLQRRSLPTNRVTTTARHPRYSLPDTVGHKDAIDVSEQSASSSFGSWLAERTPMHRFESMSAGLAWDFPLAKTEKRELLMLYMAEGENEAVKEKQSSTDLHAEPERDVLMSLRNHKARSHRSLSSRMQRKLSLGSRHMSSGKSSVRNRRGQVNF